MDRRGGNNHLKPEREQAAIALFFEGKSIREIGGITHIARATLCRIRRGLVLPDCECGSPAGHRGWCKPRFDKHPSRWKVIGRLTEKVEFDARRFAKWRRVLRKSNIAGSDDKYLKTGILLFAALELGTQNENKLCKATGFDSSFVAVKCSRMRLQNCWMAGKWVVDEDFDWKNTALVDVQFALWILVADGAVTHAPGKNELRRSAG